MSAVISLGPSSAAPYGTADFVSPFANKLFGVLPTMHNGQALMAIVLIAILLPRGARRAFQPRPGRS
jgi:hypothetical protein